MKKIIYSLMATAFLSLNANAQNFKKSISIDFGIGMVSNYAGGCSAASGFCSTKSSTTHNELTAYAGLSVTSEGKIALQFNDLYYQKISGSLSDGQIVVGKEFSLSKDILDELGIKKEYFVKPGKYKASVSAGIYTFLF